VIETPVHRLYHHFSEMPASVRVLYTSVLLVFGLAYLFALLLLFHTYSGKDGNPLTLSYDDIVIGYSGSGKGSRLESALRGSMSVMLPLEEKNVLMDWVKEGTDRSRFEAGIRPILDKRCLACHDGSNPNLPNLNGYDNLLKVTERDTGTAISTLVRVSHIHLFGLTMVFFIVCSIFSHAYVRPVWFKCTVMAMPFLCLVIDVSSWYFTKLYNPFAWAVMIAGGIMGLSFAYMWIVSMYQMWFARVPSAVTGRRAPDHADVG